MVKAALLYADRAKLCSMTSSALLDGLNFREFPIQKKLAFIEAMAVSMAGYYDTSSISDIVGRYRRAWRKRYSRDGRAQLRLLETHLEKVWPVIEVQTAKMVREAGGNGVLQARESGLLEIHTFDDALLKLFTQGAERERWRGLRISCVMAEASWPMTADYSACLTCASSSRKDRKYVPNFGGADVTGSRVRKL